jgi:hypothetical protein
VATAVVAAQTVGAVVLTLWAGAELVLTGDTTATGAAGALLQLGLVSVGLILLTFKLRRRVGWSYAVAIVVELLVALMAWPLYQSGLWPAAAVVFLPAVVALLALLTADGRAAFGRA